jgi:hypothetical protein
LWNARACRLLRSLFPVEKQLRGSVVNEGPREPGYPFGQLVFAQVVYKSFVGDSVIRACHVEAKHRHDHAGVLRPRYAHLLGEKFKGRLRGSASPGSHLGVREE